jgi:glycosyltransferase involved in cell wall biosynthesis
MRVVLTRREGVDSSDGVSIFIVALGQALIELDHQVEIVVGGPHGRAAYERLLSPRLDLPIVACRERPSGGFLAWFRAKALIDRFRPDLVIHSETLPIPLGGTVVQAVHDLEPRRGWHAPLRRHIRRASMRRCDHVVATTAELHQELVRDLGMSVSRIALIPKCVDRTLYHGRAAARRERAILHAGTSPYKDPAASIRAFGALDDATARLYVTGDVTDAVRQAAQVLPGHLRDRVELMGDLDGKAVRDLHGRVRLASFPTHYTVPVGSATVMEAIASGTPIVGSRSLSRDVLAEGVNGLAVDMEAETMAKAFRDVLDDDLLWSRLSKGAAQMAERFDAHRVAHQYLGLIKLKAGMAYGAWPPPSGKRRVRIARSRSFFLRRR